MHSSMREVDKQELISIIAVFATVMSLIIFVFLPSFFLISFTFTKWSDIYNEVFANAFIKDENWIQIQRHLALSLRIALFTVILDFLFGIPLAYLLARRRFPGKALLEDIITFPLVIPTSGFGFASLITWTGITGLGMLLGRGIVEANYLIPFVNIPFLILVVHVALTFPYIVRTLQAKLEDLEPVFEQASRTLGASSLTTFRRIVFPLSLPAIFSGGVLAFARSLGETGATMVVASIYTTAPLAIVRWVFEFKFASASFLGCILIVIASAAILPIEFFMQKRGIMALPSLFSALRVERKILRRERFASRRMAWIKDFLGLTAIVLLVIVPVAVVLNSVALSWAHDPYTGEIEKGVLYQLFGPSNYFSTLLRATLVSVTAAFISTYVATCIAIPSVYLIERYKPGRLIRSLLRIPLIVPTSALGLSVLLLWGPGGLKLVNPGIWLIILTHIVFSVPVVVEPTIAAFEGSEIPMYEGAARTLGAAPYDAVETISLPLLKRGILAGVILSFTHSLGETGATFLVMGSDVTIPPLVVNMVEALAIPAALFASAYLIALSLILLFIFRVVTKK
ncbi:MAG: Molybdate/tungstate transport system permease protein WtpB [Candidatus Bathyarchaeota archaeon BA1]|nr:MAG: Molybdate/tungstate transport system permease protein WtpB [Candidatus Bathyarchaeota archaeon BA1]